MLIDATSARMAIQESGITHRITRARLGISDGRVTERRPAGPSAAREIAADVRLGLHTHV